MENILTGISSTQGSLGESLATAHDPFRRKALIPFGIIQDRGGVISTRDVGLPGNDEDMADFFNSRAVGYEHHMQTSIEDFDTFYRGIADALPHLERNSSILDLGIGTGLELPRLFERFPDAAGTGIDLSEGMLTELADKRQPWSANLRLVQGSFLDMDLGQNTYDAVISSMALHHWIPEVKQDLYRRIRRALHAGGTFVNGDYTAEAMDSRQRLAEFVTRRISDRHQLHIDLPLQPELEQQLLEDAGFTNIRITFRRANVCIFVASNV